MSKRLKENKKKRTVEGSLLRGVWIVPPWQNVRLKVKVFLSFQLKSELLCRKVQS